MHVLLIEVGIDHSTNIGHALNAFIASRSVKLICSKMLLCMLMCRMLLCRMLLCMLMLLLMLLHVRGLRHEGVPARNEGTAEA